LQSGFVYHPKIKDVYEETTNNISKDNVRDLIKQYIAMEKVLILAMNDYNHYKLNSVRPFLKKYGLFNINAIYNDEPYQYTSQDVKFINVDKLGEYYGSDELNGILVQLRLHIGWVIQNFQDLKDFNQKLRLELENEIKKE
jgi:hypothetical protein